MTHRLFVFLLASAALAGPAAAAPQVSGAWIRAMPGNLPAGGYFTLANPDAKPISLVGADTPICGMAMLHKTEMAGGTARMTMVDKIDVPAGGKIEFKPGGYHIMCMEPKNLKPGGVATMTLRFADGSSLTVPFAVKNPTGK